MRITFLLHNAYGIGGTIRSTVNLATALSQRHDVEIVSIHRPVDTPSLPAGPRVALRSLVDVRDDTGPARDEREQRLLEQPNTVYPDSGVDGDRRMHYTALHDERIGALLDESEADVVIATRPILNGYLARHRKRGRIHIGQEHLSMDAHDDRLREDQNAAVARLDGFVTVSEGDAAQYRAALPDVATRILCIPNGVPAPEVEPSTLDSKTIVAAGRLIQIKRYDRLLDAFAKIVPQYPDWTLRIYGRGPARLQLRRRIDELGLNDSAMLMGPASPIETEWAKGAVAAVASDRESFGMTIVEAMHCGVPVVATDCPFGPAEIISHGSTGLLVPLEGGADAFAQALTRLVADEDERRAMGKAAREAAPAWAPDAIARRYEALIEELAPRRRRLTRLLGRRRPAPAARQETAPAPKHPEARARAREDGRVELTLSADMLPAGAWDFLTRLRRGERELRLPLPAADSTGRVRLLLAPLEEDFTEGRWDCWILPREGEGKRRRIKAAQVEQARLLRNPEPAADGRRTRHCIPYTTADGFLALRMWNRAAHAEVAAARPDDSGIRITARMLSARPLPREGMRLQAVHRAEPESSFDVEALPDPDDPNRFHAQVPHTVRRTGDDGIWDLRLLPGPDEPAVPLGRIGGDLADRKKAHVYAPTRLDHPELGRTRVRLYYTVDNHLALAHRTDPG
ncbi:glycosyltransferase family 4 protein [Streptomonospora sp. PA3]|uniref:glycosyltransferase n=1 Tax=Streptomonospora sp. PA3 TaxID=2607326 RepID=UPI0012DF878B|nr:glycosyltransferase [Streptomonospora sp. PA3]MUL40169.1 glycosyltransferase family 4 protein [Streptomonospora sp. PA3]